MASYSRYDVASGAFTGGYLTIPDSDLPENQVIDEGTALMPGRWDHRLYRVVDGEVKERPLLEGVSIDKVSILPDGEDVATISGVPEGAIVRVGPHLVVADETGEVEVTSDEPSSVLVVEIDHWPAQTWRSTIESAAE